MSLMPRDNQEEVIFFKSCPTETFFLTVLGSLTDSTPPPIRTPSPKLTDKTQNPVCQWEQWTEGFRAEVVLALTPRQTVSGFLGHHLASCDEQCPPQGSGEPKE